MGNKSKNWLLFIISIFLSFATIEIVLSIIDYPTARITKHDPCCGYSLSPNSGGLFQDEGKQYILINSHGLRDIEHEYNKPDNTIRIAVLGDSYAEARQVSIDEAFWSILQSTLSKCKKFNGNEIEVINFGVAGYGTAQEYEALRYKVWRYKPDIILLAFHTGNDVLNNSIELEYFPKIPYYYIKDGNLELDDSFKDRTVFKVMTGPFGNILSWMLEKSNLIRLMNMSIKTTLTRLMNMSIIDGSNAQLIEKGSNTSNRNFSSSTNLEIGLDYAIYSKPIDQRWKDAWDITEKIILKMKNDVENRGVDFFLISTSNSIQVHPDSAFKNQIIKGLDVNDLFYPDKRIRDFSNENRINNIITAYYLSDWARSNNQCLHGFENSGSCTGHWNRLGHRVAGEYIASKMCEMYTNNLDKTFNEQ